MIHIVKSIVADGGIVDRYQNCDFSFLHRLVFPREQGLFSLRIRDEPQDYILAIIQYIFRGHPSHKLFQATFESNDPHILDKCQRFFLRYLPCETRKQGHFVEKR